MSEQLIVHRVCAGCETGNKLVSVARTCNQLLIENFAIDRQAYEAQMGRAIERDELEAVHQLADELVEFLADERARQLGSSTLNFLTRVECAGEVGGVCFAQTQPVDSTSV